MLDLTHFIVISVELQAMLIIYDHSSFSESSSYIIFAYCCLLHFYTKIPTKVNDKLYNSKNKLYERVIKKRATRLKQFNINKQTCDSLLPDNPFYGEIPQLRCAAPVPLCTATPLALL